MADGYEYDVFVSYRRRAASLGWMNHHFFPRLSAALPNTLAHDPKIFLDRENIQSGQRWPEELKNAVLRSKCMVAILTPEYFRSDWCCSELESMMERQRLTKSDALILPIRLWDGEHFPASVNLLQMVDFSEWHYDFPAFADNPKYVPFSDAVREVAERLAVMIGNAPEWHDDWPLVHKLSEPSTPMTLPRAK